MKKILNLGLNPGNHSESVSWALLLLRLTVGGLMLTHGYGKLLMLFSEGPIQFPDPIGIGTSLSLILTVFAEVFCSLFLIFGLASRAAAIPLLITMWVAALIVHAPDAFSRKELPLLYSAVYIAILLIGSGKYSIDNILFKKVNH
ncbi:MAG: DoxX family protein [Bacteroidetes bacterium HGW-Bacteroidetes-4]|jgi:putative oxidoreductase|nr:MAG: DoxX family protein [Bacteroidetes bacterium HGW-Bacteroidetes-4]